MSVFKFFLTPLIKKILNNLGLSISFIHKNKDNIPIHRQKIKPVCLYGFKMFVNEAHSLNYILSKYPNYSYNFLNIHLKVKQKYPEHSIIDIGANIGDTLALIRSESSNYLYCIEGHDFYYKILVDNSKQFDNVKCIKTLLSDKRDLEEVSHKMEKGTMCLELSDRGERVHFSTIDILTEQENIIDCKLLKIDTDGYDFKIIRGAYQFLKKYKPVLFCEFDINYLLKQKDSVWDVFESLSSIGYKKIIFFDNYGNLMLRADIKQIDIIQDLAAYTLGDKPIKYYDLCLVHEYDMDIDLCNMDLSFI